MNANGRIQAGDTVTIGGVLHIVLAVGRSDCYSIVCIDQNNEQKLFTEIPFYLKNGHVRFVKRNPRNVEVARKYCKNNLLIADV